MLLAVRVPDLWHGGGVPALLPVPGVSDGEGLGALKSFHPPLDKFV